MSWTRRWKDRLTRARLAARQEFLRDPALVLFERGPESSGEASQSAAGHR